MKEKDVTNDVLFGENDGECLPLTQCVCGQKFISWDFVLSIYGDNPKACPTCGRRLFFGIKIRVYEVVDETQ